MKEDIINNAHKISRTAIVIYPPIGLVSAFATAYIKYSSEYGYTAPDILLIWLVGIVPLTIVPGIIIWCMNEFFPRMIKTTIILFLIGAMFAVWAGGGVIIAMAAI